MKINKREEKEKKFIRQIFHTISFNAKIPAPSNILQIFSFNLEHEQSKKLHVRIKRKMLLLLTNYVKNNLFIKHFKIARIMK